MRKNKLIVYALLLSMGTMIFTGCSTSKKKETPVQATTEVKAIESKNLLSVLDYDVTKCVELPENFDALEIKLVGDYDYTDEGFTNYVNSIIASYPAYEKTDKQTVESGDIVNIDYKGTIDGKEFDGSSSKGYRLTIGSATFIDGFEQGLIGKKVGEKTALDLTFPKDYAMEAYRNKKVHYDVTINAIEETKEMTKDTLTDEYVAENLEPAYKVKTKDAFLKAMEKEYREQLEQSKTMDVQNAVLAELVKQSKITLPEGLLEKSVEESRKNIESNASAANMTYEEYLKQYYNGMTDEQFKKELATSTEQSLKEELVLQAVIAAKNISVTQKDIDNFVKQYVAYYGYESEDAFYQQYGGKERLCLIYGENQALEQIAKSAKVTVTKEDSATQSSEVKDEKQDATAGTEAPTEATTEAEKAKEATEATEAADANATTQGAKDTDASSATTEKTK